MKGVAARLVENIHTFCFRTGSLQREYISYIYIYICIKRERERKKTKAENASPLTATHPAAAPQRWPHLLNPVVAAHEPKLCCKVCNYARCLAKHANTSLHSKVDMLQPSCYQS